MIIVNDVVDEVGIDDNDNDGALLLLLILLGVEDVLLIETVRDELLIGVVVIDDAIVVISGNDIGIVVAMVIGIVLLELTLCDLVGALRGDGGT